MDSTHSTDDRQAGPAAGPGGLLILASDHKTLGKGKGRVDVQPVSVASKPQVVRGRPIRMIPAATAEGSAEAGRHAASCQRNGARSVKLVERHVFEEFVMRVEDGEDLPWSWLDQEDPDPGQDGDSPTRAQTEVATDDRAIDEAPAAAPQANGKGPAAPPGPYAALSDADLGLIRATDVQEKPITWLSKYRLALYSMALLAGDGGLGKSQLLLWIASAVSNGSMWPDKSGNALIADAQDAASTGGGSSDRVRGKLRRSSQRRS